MPERSGSWRAVLVAPSLLAHLHIIICPLLLMLPVLCIPRLLPLLLPRPPLINSQMNGEIDACINMDLHQGWTLPNTIRQSTSSELQVHLYMS